MLLWHSDERGETSVKVTRRSYFALIPAFNRRKKGHVEENVIKIIHKSDICKFNPILRTLLIENVRICCIVVETSGKQSARIICASAPYIFSLICKANPKLQTMLKSEKVSSCLKILQESDFESLLSSVYRTTVVLQRGVKKYYPTVCVTLVKNSTFFTEKSLSYVFELVMKMLLTAYEFICGNLVPALQSLYHQNFILAHVLYDNLPQLMTATMKTSAHLTIYTQKVIIVGFKFIKKMISWLSYLLNRVYSDSALNSTIKYLCSSLKTLQEQIQSSDVYMHMKQTLLHFGQYAKPYITNHFQRLFEVMKTNTEYILPLLKNFIRYFLDEIIPYLWSAIQSNRGRFLTLCNAITIYLCENITHFKMIFYKICHLLYSYITYFYEIAQTVLPCIIEFSSSSAIYLISCFTSILENIVYIGQSFYIFLNSTRVKELIYGLIKQCIRLFEIIYQTITKAKPYMVPILHRLSCGLLEMIHKLSPTFKAIVYEIISSTFYASNEVVSKYCLAVKHVAPSLWYTTKTVVPPTILAINEVVNASKNSLIIVSPTVLKSILSIRPELKECIVVLFSDSNKACFEIATVSYSASCEIKDIAKTVSSNLPVVYKAVSEVLSTTTYAAIEVTSTSLNAKSRVHNDVVKVRRVVRSSVILAEKELTTALTAANSEIRSILYKPLEHAESVSNGVVNRAGTVFEKLFRSCSNFMEQALPVFIKAAENSVMCIKYILICMTGPILLFVYNIFRKLAANVKTPKPETLMIYMLNNINFSEIQRLSHLLLVIVLDVATEVALKTGATVSKLWWTTKSCLSTSWNKVCQQAPEFWEMIEFICQKVWNFTIDHAPGTWMVWKNLCSAWWELVCDLTPYVWNYFSTAVPVLWCSGRNFTKRTWRLFVTATSVLWQHATSLTSDYWLLSVTYLPAMWVVSCSTTKQSWNLACCLTENCWNTAVETCLTSWNFLHISIAKSWNRGRDFTKTAYAICCTAGSVLEKGVSVCHRTKNYIYVILDSAPQMRTVNLNSLCLIIWTNFFNSEQEIMIQSSDSDSNTVISHSTEKYSVRKDLKNHIFSFVNSFQKIHISKLLNYDAFVSSAYFSKFSIFNQAKVL